MFKRARQFFEDVKTEFKRVQWPTREATVRSTSVVLSVSLVIAVYLGIADQISGQHHESHHHGISFGRKSGT